MEDLAQVNKAKAEDEKEEVPVGEHEDGTQVSHKSPLVIYNFVAKSMTNHHCIPTGKEKEEEKEEEQEQERGRGESRRRNPGSVRRRRRWKKGRK